MPKRESAEYRSPDDYAEAISALDGLCGMILFEFARDTRSDRDVIIRNFVARTATMAKAILRLWQMADYQDCWILHRCLLDRLFHLWHLRENNEFEAFEAWSFLQQYERLNRVRSDPKFGAGGESIGFAATASQKERARSLSKNRPIWRRPKAEDVAGRLQMQFLYKYGYDYASMHVHPMANDGQQDFFTITKLKPAPDFPDQRVLLSNTVLIATMILQEALNGSSLAWRVIVFECVEQMRQCLECGEKDYRLTFLKVARLFEQRIRLCGVADGNVGTGAV